MATTTIDNTTVVFSNSTAAANLSTTIIEDTSSYLYTFDVLAASGGGTKTTLWSVDDAVKGDDNPTVVVSSAFSGYNTDLLYKDAANSWETSSQGAKFAIVGGKVVYDASGISSKINALGATESLSDTIQYTIRMSNGTLSVGTLKVTLQGTNDSVVIDANGTDATGAVTEDASATTLTDSGTIAFNDADLTDTHTVSYVAASGNSLGGSLSFGAVSELPSTTDGSVAWTYSVANSATQYLQAGETATESFTVTVADAALGGDATQVVTVTVTGVNDDVTIVAADTDAAGAVTEDASATTLSDTGTIAFNDVDLKDHHTATATAASGNALGGTLTMGTASESDTTEGGTVGWTYNVANSATQYLAKDQTATETFTVTVDDNHGDTVTQAVTVTVTGVNDDVTIVAADTDASGSVTQDNSETTLSDTGSIAFNDVDLIDEHLATVEADEDNELGGTLTLGTVSEDGGTEGGTVGWTYEVDNSAVQHLGAGKTATEKFTVTIDDQNGDTVTQEVEVTVTGVNDEASIDAGDNSDNDVVEAGSAVAGDPSAGGKLAITDLDDDEAVLDLASTGNHAGTYGTFHVAADGIWSYDLDDEAADSLNAGVVKHDKLTVTSLDGTDSYEIDVTITGANDAATIGGTNTAELTETNSVQSTGGTLTISDVDSGENKLVAQTDVAGSNGYGKFTVAADGTWTYTMNTAHDEFAANTDYTDSILVTSLDGTDSETITVTIHGTSDVVPFTAPTLAAVSTGGGDTTDNDGATGGGGSGGTLTGNDNPNNLLGNNTPQLIEGNGGADTLTARGGADTVNGGDGNDTIYGGSGNDSLNGGNDNDEIWGSSDDDKINGDAGNDVLYGGSGADQINGGDGNDSIYGGKGADQLTGGAGTDKFYYLSASDSGDHLTDFVSGSEKIDVSAINSGGALGVFGWGGQDTATANGIWWHTDGTHTTVYGDTDGITTTAEFWIVLDNVTSVSQSDFVL